MNEYTEDPERMAVKFRVEYNNQTYPCLISAEALQDHFSNAKSIGAVFAANKTFIENIALNKIKQGWIEGNGEVLIRTSDF